MTTATRHAAAWRAFTDIAVRVNVSALQLRNPGFPDQVAAILRSASLPASALGLEITETVWVADTARVADTLTALHDAGVALLLDDMGRGHTSISYLDRYPVFACFKIDRLHISALPGPRPQAIVAAIVGIGRAYDVTVVGEGVETADQLAALRAAGCDLAQGNYLAHPMDLGSVTALLRADTPAPGRNRLLLLRSNDDDDGGVEVAKRIRTGDAGVNLLQPVRPRKTRGAPAR